MAWRFLWTEAWQPVNGRIISGDKAMSLEDTRREYQYGRLTRASLRPSPFDQFRLWLQQATDAAIQDPTAMVLATVADSGLPSQRTVLLKHVDHNGFVFYTNMESRKALEIVANTRVSLLFPWFQLDRQVMIGGIARPLARAEIEEYFVTRPRESQLAAWASQQSRTLESRAVLEKQYAEIQKKFAGLDVSAPDFWGGYRVTPREFEFWQGGENRLHDRFRYLLDESGPDWTVTRLAP